MRLPEHDEEYLQQKGYAWDLLADPPASPTGGLLIIHNYLLDAAVYDRETCDLMIRIPAGYNVAQLDMFYADPEIRLKAGGYPNRADQFETHGGRRWQRFSRHLAVWRPGVDTVRTMLSFADRELKAQREAL